MTEELLDTRAAARMLGLCYSSLMKFRVAGGRPRFLKLGASVDYRRKDIEEWLAERVRTSTSDNARAVA